MPYWAFFGKKGHSLIGVTNEKTIKEMILCKRKEDFDYIKLDKEPSDAIKNDYTFYPVNISKDIYVPMTSLEEDWFYGYGYLRLLDIMEGVERIKKHIRNLRLSKEEEHDLLKSIINIYEYLYITMDSSDDFDEKAWGCTNAFNKDKFWDEFRKYRREEDETLENLYAQLMSI